VLVNYARSGFRRIDIAVGVSYGDDLDEAERACREQLEALIGMETKRFLPSALVQQAA